MDPDQIFMNKKDAGEILKEGLSWYAEHTPDNIAIISDGRSISYRELYRSVERLMDELQGYVTDSSVVVAIRFEDPVRHMITSLALLLMGISQVSIGRKESLPSQKNIIMQTGAGLLIEDKNDLPDLCFETILLNDDLSLVLRSTAIDKTNIYTSFSSHKQKRTALIVIGSGTTGRPKTIAIDFEILGVLIQRDIAIRPFEEGEKHYSVTVLDYYTAKRRALGCLLSGVTLLLPSRSIKKIVSFCNEYKVDHLSLTTVQAMRILEEEKYFPDENKPRLPGLKTLYVGGSPVSEILRETIKNKLSGNLYVVYGSNEFGEATIATPYDQQRHSGTVGKPCPDVSVKIIDDHGKICKSGVKGHICLWSETMMNSYVPQSDTLQKVFTKEGFYPGDMGRLTEDGNLVFEGRSDDMMIYRGVNIYPREIESVLEAHPNVIEAAAFPLTTKEHEQIPVATVSINAPTEEAELVQWCTGELGWKGPQRIFFVQNLPRNDAGKVKKNILAQKIVEKLANKKAKQKNTEMRKLKPFKKGSSVLVISPHCDDAAFSIGGIIKKYSYKDVKFTILTCFSKSKYMIGNTTATIEEISSMRKKEDHDFYRLCHTANVRLLYLDLPEAPLRKNRAAKHIFSSKLTEDENILITQLARTIALLMKNDTLLLFPSAVGGHIDHVIVNKACSYLAKQHKNHMQYLDLPYTAMVKNIDALVEKNYTEVMVFDIIKEIKKDILSCYPSQLHLEQIEAILGFDFNLNDGLSKEVLLR